MNDKTHTIQEAHDLGAYDVMLYRLEKRGVIAPLRDEQGERRFSEKDFQTIKRIMDVKNLYRKARPARVRLVFDK